MNGMEIDLKKLNSFFFDFDGVIVDSLEVKSEAFGELFREYGEEVMEKVRDYHRDNGGVSRYEKFRYYYRQLLKKEITPEIIRNLDRQFSSLVVEKVVKAEYIPGVIDFLSLLKERQARCFVVSATPEPEIREIIERRGINDFFRDVAGSPATKSADTASLPGRYSLSALAAVFFGDARSDYEAAKENGVSFVGVGGAANRELQSLGKIEMIDDFTSISVRKEK